MCDLYIRPIFRKIDDEDEIVVACTAVVVYSLGAAVIAAKSKKQKHSTWVKQYVMYNVLSGLAACGRLGVAARASGVLFVTRRGTRRGTRRRARR